MTQFTRLLSRWLFAAELRRRLYIVNWLSKSNLFHMSSKFYTCISIHISVFDEFLFRKPGRFVHLARLIASRVDAYHVTPTSREDAESPSEYV